jgi:serine beta-lactamase-like protein LACTB, mitochondrial
MATARISVWRVLVFSALGLALLVPALWVFVSFTAKPLYPSPESVPSAAASAPPPDSATAVEKARRIVRAAVAEQNLPGLSIAVGVGSDVVWAEGFGYADLYTSTLVTPEHQFRIGTASILLTSAAAGLLLESGRLKLTDEIQTYVPSFPRKQWPVTVRELMADTAGMRNEEFFNRQCDQTSGALQYFAGSPLQFQPGTRYAHSSSGWILVSKAVETAAGQPFIAFMQQRIFEPMGMSHTVSDATPDREGEDFPIFILIRELIHDPEATRGATSRPARPPAGLVTHYYTRFASDPNYGMHVARLIDQSCYAGAAAFVSTPSDLVRFAMAIHRGKLLQPATVTQLQTLQRLSSGEETGHTLGWYIKNIVLAGKPTRVIGQDGASLGGMVATLLTLPDSGIVVAVTSNISHADTNSIAQGVAEAFALQTPQP